MSMDLKNQIQRCNRCGSCLAVCPVYEVLLQEMNSPRGKMALASTVTEGASLISSHMTEILSQCLLCGGCQTVCPSGVQAKHIFSDLRRSSLRSAGINWRTLLLAKLLNAPRIMDETARFSRMAREIMELLVAHPKQATRLDFSYLPRLSRPFFRNRIPHAVYPSGKARGVAIYFYGCATNFLFAEVGDSVVRALVENGWEVHIPHEQVCCGMPILMSGNYEQALANMERNLSLFTDLDCDAVVVDCATCGIAFTQEYPRILEMMGHDLKRTQAVSKKIRDITELLLDHTPAQNHASHHHRGRIQVTYHDPCHLAKGRNIRQEPRMFLKSLPYVDYIEMSRADACCGGGGTFQFEYPEISARITDRKVRNIVETGAQIVASGCPSCRMTLQRGLKNSPVRIYHPVQLFTGI
jgi:glycolate oxidase iron-sulfur subunit